MRIHIETTIPSFLVSRSARDLLQAARQQLTQDWWNGRRQEHDLFTSQVCLDEAAQGDAEMSSRRLPPTAMPPGATKSSAKSGASRTPSPPLTATMWPGFSP
jgi:hypothetical protein